MQIKDRSEKYPIELALFHDAGTVKCISSKLEEREQEAVLTLMKTAKNEDGLTALMLAALKGKADSVEFFLEKGLPIDEQHWKNGWTALMFAASEDFDNVVHLLLSKGANKEKCNKGGKTAYDLAVDRKANDAAKLLKI